MSRSLPLWCSPCQVPPVTFSVLRSQYYVPSVRLPMSGLPVSPCPFVLMVRFLLTRPSHVFVAHVFAACS